MGKARILLFSEGTNNGVLFILLQLVQDFTLRKKCWDFFFQKILSMRSAVINFQL